MHATGSVLITALDRIRGYMDESSSKWTNDHIVRHMLMPEYVNVWARLTLSREEPILIRHRLDLNSTDQYYQLPPNVGEVWGIIEWGTDGRKIRDWAPKGRRADSGPGWAIEGNTLSLEPLLNRASHNLDLWYMPNGDFMPHYAEDGTLEEVDDEVKRLYLTDSPKFGVVDRRPEAYAGSVLRLLPDSPGVVEERIISTHKPEANPPYVEVRIPFTHARESLGDPWSGSSESETSAAVKYEITPFCTQSFISAMAASAAMSLGVRKDVSDKKMKHLNMEYRKHLKTAGDHLANINMRKPKGYRRDGPGADDHTWFVS